MEDGSDIIKFGPFGSVYRGESWDGKGHADILQIFENGKLALSELHGTRIETKFATVTLDYPKEYIVWIRGYTTNYTISSISFGTNLGEYGPFGKIKENHREFIVNLGKNRQFFGFHGTVGFNGSLVAIGVYMKLNKTLNLVKKIKEEDSSL